MSESFANAAWQRITRLCAVDCDGPVHGTLQPTTISYDATDQSYTLSTGDNSITFLPSDIDATKTNSTQVTYAKSVDALTTDALTLTRPGTSGYLTYRYVGSALWYRRKLYQPGDTHSGTAIGEAIVYGIPTPAAAIPLSGTAKYALDVFGYEFIANGPGNPIEGAGVATIDFGVGTVDINAYIRMGGIATGGQFSGTAALASGGFSGTLHAVWTTGFNGNFAGMLFGPDADEFGASFDLYQAIGTFMGRKHTPPATPTTYLTLDQLTGNQLFDTAGISVPAGTGGSNSGMRYRYGTGVTVAYDAGSDSYTLTTPQGYAVTVDDTNISQTSADTVTFVKSDGAGTTDTIALTRPSINGVKLSYTLLGNWDQVKPASHPIDYAVGGVPTLFADLPITGRAYYNMGLIGGGTKDGKDYILTSDSTVTFWANFDFGQVNVQMALKGAESGKTSVSLGSYSGSGPILGGGPGFVGSLDRGSFAGSFFGPQAKEVAYSFYIGPANAPSETDLHGVAYGVKK